MQKVQAAPTRMRTQIYSFKLFDLRHLESFNLFFSNLGIRGKSILSPLSSQVNPL